MATLYELPFTLRRASSEPTAANTGAWPADFAELPATYRTHGDSLTVPSSTDLIFLQRELLVRRIDNVRNWLWVCGRPMPARPLHHQLLIERDIAITENPELHLVWGNRRIYLKPIPEWLLSPQFWEKLQAGSRYDGAIGSDGEISELIRCARGFLFSYCALITYRSDFNIAVDKGLLPPGVTWAYWKQLSSQLQESHSYKLVNPRYWYGELRLSRLNKIYMYGLGQLLRGYSSVGGYAVYNDLLRDNFAVLAGLLGYVALVLTAMQVGLGVERLQTNGSFQNISYGFTVFAIIAPLASTGFIVTSTVFLFWGHWLATRHYQHSRFKEMGVQPDWLK